MSDSKPPLSVDAQLAVLEKLTVEERLAMLELQVIGIRSELAGIREIIDAEHKHFIHLLAGKDRVFDAILDRLELIEDRLEPAFIKTFPDYGQALHEIDAILDAPRKR